MKHAKKQEIMNNSQGKNKLIETVPRTPQTLDLLDQDFKSTVLKYAQRAKGNLSKEIKPGE